MAATSSISRELHIVRHQHGVKLVRPDFLNHVNLAESPALPVSDIYHLPFNAYFIDVEHNTVAINDASWQTSAFISEQDALGNSMKKVCVNSLEVSNLFARDRHVINQKKWMICEENLNLINDNQLRGICLRLPWFDETDKCRGIFGCAVISNSDSVISHFNSFIHSLLSTQTTKPVPDRIKNKNCFSPRELQVIHWIIRGKTMQQIADILHLSRRTIESYFENIKIKAVVRTKSELIEMVLNNLN